MDFKEFWEDYYTTNKSITTFSDLVIDVFSQKIPDNIEEEYDLGEVITEFSGHHETAKKFEEIEAFGKVIKNKQPRLYEREGKYLNEALIKYFCFIKDEEKLQEQIKDVLARDYDYDLLLQSFKQLLYNQHIDKVNQIIEQEYENVKNSPDLIEGAELDLAIVKYYIELEYLYSEQKDALNIDFSQFKKRIHQYDFEFDDLFFQYQKTGLFDESSDKIDDLLKGFPENKKDRKYILLALEMRFLKWMQAKNCPFPVAGMLWYNLIQYLMKGTPKNWKQFFTFKSAPFKEFIRSKSGFIYDFTTNKTLIIWGSSYLLDFIYENKIISEIEYSSQKKIIKKIKDEFKEKNKYNLWEYNFVHQWKPDETTDPASWAAEKDEFEHSYELEINYDDYKYNGPSNLNLEDLWGPALNPKNNSRNPIVPQLSKPQPKIDGKKIGRNQKINVKYKDGTITKDVKYKKVMRDIENGECEII